MNGSDERIAVTSALASMLAALTLVPLVDGLSWVFVAAIAVVTTMVTGIIARQLVRWWPAVAVVQLVVLVLTLLILFARSRVVEGLGAVTLLRDLLDAGLQVTREQAPPVESAQGVMLLVAGSIGLVAVMVDLLAATLRQPALAGLPLLAVYCVPAALLDGGLPWYYFLVAASGFLLLLTADSGDRVRSWGRVLAAGARQPADGGMARGGSRVGAAAVLLAVALPTLVPGLSNQIIGGSGEGDGSGGKGRTISRINPILDLSKDLNDVADSPLLTYSTGLLNPEPLRIVTEDEFDGKTWQPSTAPIPRSQTVDRGMPPAPGLGNAATSRVEQTRIRIGGLDETYLPLPYPAVSVSAPGTWLYDNDTLNVIGDGNRTRNLSYSVRHLVVTPDAEQLSTSLRPQSAISAKYTALPDDLPAVISARAREVGKTGSDYQKAVRLQRWLRDGGGFEYSLKAPQTRDGNSGVSGIEAFLQVKKGYCVHFASTMAVMARTLDIPARVAVGFLPGESMGDGSRLISANDAHAWPELYFEGAGWVRFEPTPRSAASTPPPPWTNPPNDLLPEEPAVTDEAPEPSAEPSAAAPSQAAPSLPAQSAAPDEGSGAGGVDVPWRALLVVLALVTVLAVPRLAAIVASRRRWNRARTVPELAEAAWEDLRLGLGDLGVRWADSWTPRAVREHLSADHLLDAQAREALERLSTEIESARYAPPDEELGRTPSERSADVAAVSAAVASGQSTLTRWQVRMWPRSGLDALIGIGRRMNIAADRTGQQASALGSRVRGRVTGPDGGGAGAHRDEEYARERVNS